MFKELIYYIKEIEPNLNLDEETIIKYEEDLDYMIGYFNNSEYVDESFSDTWHDKCRTEQYFNSDETIPYIYLIKETIPILDIKAYIIIEISKETHIRGVYKERENALKAFNRIKSKAIVLILLEIESFYDMIGDNSHNISIEVNEKKYDNDIFHSFNIYYNKCLIINEVFKLDDELAMKINNSCK